METYIIRNYIIQILDQLNVDYQNTKSERSDIAANYSQLEDEFSVLEEIELLTTDIRGYANQIKFSGDVDQGEKSIVNLQKMRLFDVPSLAKIYFSDSGQYPNVKSYLRTLDYLRLLILAYLNLFQSHKSEDSTNLS